MRPDPRLDALLAYASAHLDADLRVSALAEQAGMSPSHLSRWFRERTGTTPHAWVVRARVERAKSLLRGTEMPLIEIALAVGLGSQSCLNVSFRKHVGMTPAEYRARHGRKTKDPSGADG